MTNMESNSTDDRITNLLINIEKKVKDTNNWGSKANLLRQQSVLLQTERKRITEEVLELILEDHFDKYNKLTQTTGFQNEYIKKVSSLLKSQCNLYDLLNFQTSINGRKHNDLLFISDEDSKSRESYETNTQHKENFLHLAGDELGHSFIPCNNAYKTTHFEVPNPRSRRSLMPNVEDNKAKISKVSSTSFNAVAKCLLDFEEEDNLEGNINYQNYGLQPCSTERHTQYQKRNESIYNLNPQDLVFQSHLRNQSLKSKELDSLKEPTKSNNAYLCYFKASKHDNSTQKNLPEIFFDKQTEGEINFATETFLNDNENFEGNKRNYKEDQTKLINFGLPAYFNGRNLESSNSEKDYSLDITKDFKTARQVFGLQNLKKIEQANSIQKQEKQPLLVYGASKKSLGTRRTVQDKFLPPIISEKDNTSKGIQEECTEVIDERLKNIDPKMVELISNEIMHRFKPIDWNDIAGLEYAKSTIQEAVVWPLLRPDIFTGIRRPPRGILLFGPPGTGKTLIGKCIASQSKATFFSISASSLTSKWVGEGEKMVRALFAVASVRQPSVVFIDEIDSLLTQRSVSEHESTRRIKTEFLVQLDGAATSEEERILIVGATNRPQELDEAARRRFVRRLYIPLPVFEARVQILKNLLNKEKHSLTRDDIVEISRLTEGYSGADMETLCREASMEGIRSIPPEDIQNIKVDNLRGICFSDFLVSLRQIRASVSQGDLLQYVNWNKAYGSGLA